MTICVPAVSSVQCPGRNSLLRAESLDAAIAVLSSTTAGMLA